MMFQLQLRTKACAAIFSSAAVFLYPVPASASADQDALKSFCAPLIAATEAALTDGGETALHTLFEAEEFKSSGRDTTSWTISVGSIERDIFVDNVVFPELRNAPGYLLTSDADGDNFIVPLAIAFEEQGAEEAFTSANWADASDGLTRWFGYASRVAVSGETYESVCWVDENSL